MSGTDEAVSSSLITEFYSDAGLAAEVPSKRPNKRGEQTRERLIKAATECFTEYGYTRTRISDVVHRADTAQGNFYRHFGSLDEAFLAVLRPGLEELASASTRRSGHSTDLASLVETNSTYLHTYARHRHILRLLREAAASSPNDGFQSLWLRLRGDFVARTRRWLVRLHEAGKIEDVNLDLLAESLGCLTEQMAYVHVGLPPTTPRRERIDELGQALGEAWFRLIPRRVSELDLD
ncbi:TetR/AcrR family transcriptional regulator [Kribbia dieselivorans]|uniref:TetR/AcrR family transcriptional regulator n=1 Tax=Kribbia dieselivorans TaxID=331526 RepID=UPI000839406E|nr:TetR/AcrR family transcriptional regulator [Kribbia dieselivorans]